MSIISPAYNAAAVIGEMIESVVAQTYDDWELLIAEDCGPDNTRKLVAQWEALDSRVKLIKLERNVGPAGARNAALRQARGRWVAFLDSDDIWMPTKLARQLAFHRSLPGTKISFTGYRRISADGRRTGHYIRVPPRIDYRRLLGNTAILTSTVIIDREASGAFTMKHTYYDDFACWLALLKPGGEAAGLDEDLARYRVLDKSVSRNKSNSAKQVWLTYRKVEGLGRATSILHFIFYAWHAWRKYRHF